MTRRMNKGLRLLLSAAYSLKLGPFEISPNSQNHKNSITVTDVLRMYFLFFWSKLSDKIVLEI